MSYFNKVYMEPFIAAFLSQHPEISERHLRASIRYKVNGICEDLSTFTIGANLADREIKLYKEQGYDERNFPISKGVSFCLIGMPSQCGMSILHSIGGHDGSGGYNFTKEFLDVVSKFLDGLHKAVGYSQILATMPSIYPQLKVLQGMGFTKMGDSWKNCRSGHINYTLQRRTR